MYGRYMTYVIYDTHGIGIGIGRRMIFFFFFLGFIRTRSGRSFFNFFNIIFFFNFPSHGLTYSLTNIKFSINIARNVKAVFFLLYDDDNDLIDGEEDEFLIVVDDIFCVVDKYVNFWIYQ